MGIRICYNVSENNLIERRARVGTDLLRIWTFQPAHRGKVCRTPEKIQRNGGPAVPHITLGGYAELPLNTLINWVHTFADSQQPLKMNFNHVGWFSGGIWFIAPRVSAELLAFHHAFHANYDSCLRVTGYNYTLCSENWVPHVSVFTPEENASQSDIEILLNSFQPFTGEMSALSIYEEQSNQPLARFELTNAAGERTRGEA